MSERVREAREAVRNRLIPASSPLSDTLLDRYAAAVRAATLAEVRERSFKWGVLAGPHGNTLRAILTELEAS